MTKIKQIMIGVLVTLFAVACNEGIDPITPMEPGPDETAPSVTIKYPSEGTKLQVPEAETPIDIEFEVTDDIEIGSISVKVDDNEIANFSDFKDYRRALKTIHYENVTNGQHTLSVTATDLEGKSTTKTVNFEKVSPYTPKYDGEMFYMPFDGNYMELISFQSPTVVGTPGFAGEGVQGGNAYKGASGSYLTFPADGLKTNEFSAVFWMKINAVPDRAGILVMSPEDAANPDAQNVRTSGFRFFREGNATRQVFKLNVGSGASDIWFDGGDAAAIDPSANNSWIHFAFTISQNHATVYINGQVVSEGDFDGIDWTGVDIISIMSGAPRFTGWDHNSDLSFMDELRLFNKALSQDEIQNIFTAESGQAPQYQAKYGEIFYMPFDGNFTDLVTGNEATVVGNPGFSDNAVEGQAYAGATDSYLTFPGDRFQNEQLSATMWYNINPVPDRAGILIMSPEDTENANYPDIQNLRTSGFRFFRETGANSNQRFKLNVGTGDAEVWFDGGENADVDPTTGEWRFLAFTISADSAKVYINGEVVSEAKQAGIDWTGADLLSIMSGTPRFTEWNHFFDLSLLDELRIFDKVLTQDQIQNMMNDEQ